MNNTFRIIKTQLERKYELNEDVYLKYGEILLNALERMGLDGDEEFENDTFKIVPYDYDGNTDCTCYIDEEVQNLPYNNDIDKAVMEYENNHMHTIDCGSHKTNFYHKPTRIAVSWRKRVSRFEYINKYNLTIEAWKDVVEDCIKSVLGDEYIEDNENLNKETLQPRKQWLEERYYKIIHILNESKAMSAELLKECQWLAGELLKECDK